MFKLQSPIPKTYFSINKECFVNQWFGENLTSFYAQMGLLGHNGIDLKSKFTFRWIRNWFDAIVRGSTAENLGVIPILASHDGYLSVGYNNSRTAGIYMKILSPEVEIDGKPCKVETVYFHLNRIRVWRGDDHKTALEQINGDDFVKAGTIIGWSGNTGQYTTGAHLHFGMKILWKVGREYVAEKSNGYDGCVDPMPFFQDDVIYKKYFSTSKVYKNGKLI